MDVSVLKEYLERYGARPLKSRGQHFLLDENVVQKMIAAARVKAGDTVVEIGPGPGILTAALLEAGASVTAVELDMKMQALQKDRFEGKAIHIMGGDVLSFTNSEIHSEETPYKVVANLPYNITSSILQKFLFEEPKPLSMTIMIQREVADRIMATPGQMSALAVMVQTMATVEKVVNVPKGAFYPPPKVDSSVIHMALKSPQELDAFFGPVDSAEYFRVGKTAFSGKRKKLKNTLSSMVSDKGVLENALISAEIPVSARPEEVGIAGWIMLTKALQK